MKRRIVLPFLAVALSFLVSCNNDDDDVVEPDSPVDWFHYCDIQEYLKEQGFTVFTASYGPLSSNWDRAVELYYYIKGGMVDYGAVHAMRHGHDLSPSISSMNETNHWP